MKLQGPEIVVEGMVLPRFSHSYAIVSTCFHSCYEKDPVCGAYGGLYPNLSRINFLGPSFFRNKFPFPKKGTTPRRIWYTTNIQNQFWDHGGSWGQTSLDKVPVAKVLFIPLQVSNKLRSEKLHTFLWLQPQCR